jgi:hypothetical protein
MSGAVKAGSVAVYDHEQRCHITGAGGTLYHYGNHAHITLQLNGPNFSGYDYDSKAHFSGTVNQQSISVYDYGAKAFYNYSL